MANKVIQGFTRDEVTSALVVTGLADPITQAYVNATGLPASYIPALDGLVTGLRSKNLLPKLIAVYAMIGGTAALHKWNLLDPRDTDSAYRLTFTGGQHSDSLGFRANPQGNVVGGSYADTHLVPLDKMQQDSTHLAFYSLLDVPVASRAEMGCFNWGPAGSAARFHIIARYQPTYFYYGMSESGTSNVDVPASSGLFVATRTGVATQVAYRNGVQLAANSNDSIALPPQPVWIGAIDDFSDRSDLPCGFASIGSGLTPQNVADLYSVVQAYQTALGRQI